MATDSASGITDEDLASLGFEMARSNYRNGRPDEHYHPLSEAEHERIRLGNEEVRDMGVRLESDVDGWWHWHPHEPDHDGTEWVWGHRETG